MYLLILVKRNRAKNKQETNEFCYPQDIRYKGRRVLEMYSSGIILAFESMFLLFTQKHKPTRMKVNEKSKVEYDQKQKTLNIFQINTIST